MNNPSPPQSSKAEQRDYFRVSQDVIFDYHAVDNFAAEEGNADNEFDDSVSLNLIHELRRLDKDNAQTLRLLTEKNRLLGDYLQTLSSKIDVIARYTLSTHDNASKNKPKTRINLSEDGMAFLADRMLYKNSYIAVRLVFLPNYAPVACYAQIIRCEQKDDETYQVAVKFHRLSEADRKELSRQIMRTQVQGRKKQQNDHFET